MTDKVYVLYDPDGRGLLVAVTYRILKNNDVAGWYYGYTGQGVYQGHYFLLTRNASLEPVHFYAGASFQEWDMDFLLENPGLEATMFVPETTQQVLTDIRQQFVEHWFLPTRQGDYTLNDARLKEMELEEDDSYSYLSQGVDRKLLGFVASRWPLQDRTLVQP